MVIKYLNESRDPYLDNFQSNLIFATRLSSHVGFVSICCIYGDRPPPLIFSCFLRFLDDPVLNTTEGS